MSNIPQETDHSIGHIIFYWFNTSEKTVHNGFEKRMVTSEQALTSSITSLCQFVIRITSIQAKVQHFCNPINHISNMPVP